MMATPQEIVDFRLPEQTGQHIEALIAKSNENPSELSAEEEAEIKQFLALDHLMRILKASSVRKK